MKDESEAIVRLADSIAGFVRDALEEKSPLFKRLFTKAKNDKTFMEI